jgi:general secretion pathway protein E
MLIVSEAIRHLIVSKADSPTIFRKAVEEGMQPLREDGTRKVVAGITTLEELVRVTQE